MSGPSAEGSTSTVANSSGTNTTVTSTTISSGTGTPAHPAVSMMQSLMSSAVQAAMPSLQASLTSSLDSRIQNVMQQQREQLQTWLQQQLHDTRSSGQTHMSTTISTCTISTTSPAEPYHSTSSTGITVPTGGNITPANLISNVPIMSVSSIGSGAGFSNTLGCSADNQGSASLTLTPHTPLASLLPPLFESASTASKKAIVIGTTSPPIPRKLAEAIWRDEFIDLAELLPARLGAPEPTLLELFSGDQSKWNKSKKAITTIEEWILCFNAYIAVMAQKQPNRVPDLLAYSSLIVKASRDYEDTPWLSYDQHYRRHVAVESPKNWGAIQPEIWTLYFGRAKAKIRCLTCGESDHTKCDGVSNASLDMVSYTPPPQQLMPVSNAAQQQSLSQQARSNMKWPRSNQLQRSQPYTRPSPICKRWNRGNCRQADCSFRHICLECHGNHKEAECKSKPPKSQQLSRGSSSLNGN